MLNYVKLMQPKTMEEAYELYTKNKMAPVFAGGCWIRLARRNWPMVIDLSGLELRYIRETDGEYHIGAMTTQREVETYDAFQHFCGGILPKAVKPILGLQFRNQATIGASVASKFGFSDIIPALLALHADVVLYKEGRLSLADYLRTNVRDILTEVVIPAEEVPVAIEALRKSVSDFPHLTGAVRKDGDAWELYIGTRPAAAKLAVRASQALSEDGYGAAEEAARLAAEEIPFQTNSHATKEYRQLMTKGMVKRLAAEVASWK